MSSLTNPGNAYVLNKGTNGVGFYRLAPSGTIGANKAYLTYSGSLVREFFLFEDDATGIESIQNSSQSSGVGGTKFIILNEDAIYNLSGQKVDASYKGIVIQNGKKRLSR